MNFKKPNIYAHKNKTENKGFSKATSYIFLIDFIHSNRYIIHLF